MDDAPPHLAVMPRVAEEAVGAGELDARLKGARAPFVVRGLAADWPLVRAGLEGADTARAYLIRHARDRSFPANCGTAAGDTRIFYDAAMRMNFRMVQDRLDALLAKMAGAEGRDDAAVLYLSSIDMRGYFDGLAEANSLPLGERRPLESIWIGTPTRIAAHNDVPDNLAVCAVGRRRFTLFPPEQMANLYPGPLDNTPAGRAVSMVDLLAPDLDRFPRFADALRRLTELALAPADGCEHDLRRTG